MRRPEPDLMIVAVVLAVIGAVLVVDALPGLLGYELARQLVLAALTWLVLILLLRPESVTIRVQTMIVVVLATIVEYTFSPLLEAYTYRIGTVPGFVPPGHGLVYLAALALGRSRLLIDRARFAVGAVVVLGGGWALYGLLLAERQDVLGAFWFVCLLGFLAWGRARLLYVGAFVVVSYLEIIGTALGTWSWQPTDPVLHVISQGNPPSGAAGGYGWFDLYAGLLSGPLIAWWARVRARLPGRPRSAATDATSTASESPQPLEASDPPQPAESAESRRQP